MTAQDTPATVLVVEDDEVARRALVALLQGQGWRVNLASDGRAALDLLAKGLQPSLILLDMILPNVDGWRFLELHRSDPDLDGIPVVITTGLTVASPEWAHSLGAVGFLRKPVDADALLDLVRQHTRAKPH